MRVCLGIDVGSVTTKVAALDEADEIVASRYGRTEGRPVVAVQRLLKEVAEQLPADTEIAGVGTTGSGRYLAGAMLGADVIKNEITAHSVAASHYFPETRTILEIGGQDSKIIILRDGVVVDFAMNTVCAAGTGSFLDQQAFRLKIGIEEFGPMALQSQSPVRIAGRCTVFAESDMIHKQQMGHSVPDILYGLCDALARNYLNNLGLGKEILSPVVFQGGVAANQGMIRAFEQALNCEILVPRHHHIMGAIGAALLAHEQMGDNGRLSSFRGFGVTELDYRTSSFECKGCSNRCEIVEIKAGRELLARWGGRCGKWDV
ncbi:MAG: acyl-CoA dehydratase activase [Chloroflexota bacterium]